jgi:DNA-binding NarL/FixJ family response regulator
VRPAAATRPHLAAVPSTGPSAAPDVLRVLVVDALPLAGFGLRALVDSTAGLSWCGAVNNIETALSVAARLRPHVVLVDSCLDPGAAGARSLLATERVSTVIGLVHNDNPHAAQYVRAARASGVAGLVARSSAPGVIVAAVRTAHSGRPFLDPELAGLQSALTVETEHRMPLSDRQRQILHLIAQGRRNGDIAESLFVSVETVRTHVKEILRRLGAHDRAHAVARGYEAGLLGKR